MALYTNAIVLKVHDFGNRLDRAGDSPYPATRYNDVLDKLFNEAQCGKEETSANAKKHIRPSERPRPPKEPIEAPTEAQEQEHRAWITRHGYDYISLAETVRLWQRSPEQILRWERQFDSRPALAPHDGVGQSAANEG